MGLMGQSLCKKGGEQSRGRSRATKMHSHDASASPRAAMALTESCQAGQFGLAPSRCTTEGHDLGVGTLTS